MFGKRDDLTGPQLLAKPSKRRAFVVRFTQAALHLGESPRHTSVHIVTATEAGAWAQVTAVADQSRDLDIPVARLRATDTDEQRAEAYRAPVVVGTREDFTADLGKEEALGITRQAAMVEGKKAEVATLRAAYPKSFRT